MIPITVALLKTEPMGGFSSHLPVNLWPLFLALDLTTGTVNEEQAQVECLLMCVYVLACPLLPPPPSGVCRLLSSVMSGTESHTDREEDYRFLHSMLMEKKLHLLFKVKTHPSLFVLTNFSHGVCFFFKTALLSAGWKCYRSKVHKYCQQNVHKWSKVTTKYHILLFRQEEGFLAIL